MKQSRNLVINKVILKELDQARNKYLVERFVLLIPFAGKLALEFLYTTSGVNKSLLTGVSGVRIHSYISNKNAVVNAINVL